jgi:hypothetical protein
MVVRLAAITPARRRSSGSPRRPSAVARTRPFSRARSAVSPPAVAAASASVVENSTEVDLRAEAIAVISAPTPRVGPTKRMVCALPGTPPSRPISSSRPASSPAGPAHPSAETRVISFQLRRDGTAAGHPARWPEGITSSPIPQTPRSTREGTVCGPAMSGDRSGRATAFLSTMGSRGRGRQKLVGENRMRVSFQARCGRSPAF